ncbi:MAG: metallopeptidase TldD-related protein, partial [Bacteroidales bacterium]|nr:metallopeptidase TldD-related protein [Bacteroidales bacterium]
SELRRLLIEEAKKQGKEYGYYFKKVTGGFTQISSTTVNSFNVTPLEVYKVFVDGRKDELVRGVDIIGTPLSMFSNIIYAGGDPEVFTGTCGASSGNIPVTAISPTILVNKVELQRKPQPSNIPPILPRY